MNTLTDNKDPSQKMLWLAMAANVLALVCYTLNFRFADNLIHLTDSNSIVGLICGLAFSTMIWSKLKVAQHYTAAKSFRRIWLLGAFCLLISQVISIFGAHDLAALTVARFFLMGGLGITNVLPISYAQRVVGPSRQGNAVSLMVLGSFIGLAIGAAITDVIFFASSADNFQALYVAGTLAAITLIGVIASIPDIAGDPTESAGIDEAEAKSTLLSWPLILAALATGAGFAVNSVFMTRFLADTRGGFSLFFAAYCAVAVALHLTTRNWVNIVGSKQLIIMGLATSAFSQFSCLLVTETWHVLYIAATSATARCFLNVALVEMASRSSTNKINTKNSAKILTAVDLGTLAWTLVMGVSIDALGFGATFVVLGAIVSAVCIQVLLAGDKVSTINVQRRRQADWTRRRGDISDAFVPLRSKYLGSRKVNNKKRDPMDVVIFGATGSSGGAVTELILSSETLQATDKLKLVARTPENIRVLRAKVNDWRNCFSGLISLPEIEIIDANSDDCGGDIVIVSAANSTKALAGREFLRKDLAQMNQNIFDQQVALLQQSSVKIKHMIVISNPNELAVKTFQEGLPAVNVLGMGSHSDSIRFCQELAYALNLHPTAVKGMVGGEHGDRLVPLWSTIQINGPEQVDLSSLHWLNYKTCRRLRAFYESEPNPEAFEKLELSIKKHKALFKSLMDNNAMDEVYVLLERMPPDLKMALRPVITCTSGSTTALGTARATIEVLWALLSPVPTMMCLQVYGKSPFTLKAAAIGVPVEVSQDGFKYISSLKLPAEELQQLRSVAEQVNEELGQFETKTFSKAE